MPMVWYNLQPLDTATSPSEPGKSCRLCARMLPLTNYGVRVDKADGHESRCRECRNSVMREGRKRGLAELLAEDDDPPEKRVRLTQPTLPTIPGEHLYIMALSTDPEGLLSGLKVGRSGNIPRRAFELANSMPHTMLVLATFPGRGYLEEYVHSILTDSRNTAGRGREWFFTPLSDILHAVACAMQARPKVNGGSVGSTQQRLGSSRRSPSLAGGQEEGPESYEETSGGLREGEGFEADLSSSSTGAWKDSS
jgi:hypothetical protein